MKVDKGDDLDQFGVSEHLGRAERTLVTAASTPFFNNLEQIVSDVHGR